MELPFLTRCVEVVDCIPLLRPLLWTPGIYWNSWWTQTLIRRTIGCSSEAVTVQNWPLQWEEWFGQIKSAIDSKSLTDDVKLIYLKTVVTGTPRTTTGEFAYCGILSEDLLRRLKRKLRQPEAVVTANLDDLSSFLPLKMHNSDNIINYSPNISSLVGIFK